MSELPKGWAITDIQSIATDVVVGFVGTSKTHYRESGVPFLTGKNIKNGKIDLRKIDHITNEFHQKEQKSNLSPGDVVVVRIGRSGEAAVIPESLQDSNCGGLVVIKNPLGMLPNLISAYLNSPSAISSSQLEARGATRQTLNTKNIAEKEILVPPLAEQTRIVQKLDELLTQIDTLKTRIDAIPALLKRFRQSVLAAAVSGRLTEDWRDMNPERRAEQTIKALKAARPAKEQEHTPVFFEELPHIPENWEWASLGFLVSPDEALCYGVVQPGSDDPDGVYLIRAGDLNSGSVDTSQLRKISVTTNNEYRRSQVKGGEILITVVGAGIGETAIIPAECAGFNIARAVAKLPIREISAKYVYLWLSTSLALSWMKGSSREVARPTLNLEQLRALPVPIPAYSEQVEIVRRVEQLFPFADQLEAKVASAKSRIDHLTQSILAKAFRGELVPQDPNDEPASLLLERIQAQRAAAPKAKRGRKASA